VVYEKLVKNGSKTLGDIFNAIDEKVPLGAHEMLKTPSLTSKEKN